MPVRIDPPRRALVAKGWLRTKVYEFPQLSRRYWIFKGAVYSSEHNLSAKDVMALVLDGENRAKARLARARLAMETAALVKDEPKHGRRPIPDRTKMAVWQRDRGVCVKCGSNKNLEFDHIIPVSKGGSNTARNLQLLCEQCNGAKGGNLV
jgi:hypothetical protein